ncbi:MAG: hypothetical protein FWF18_02430 [Dehalococcoidia bacterium]|nr:hypothetical protein [Dehalococcoidia bacterium]
MSRFVDKLKNALQVAPPSMGFFRTIPIASKPKLLLVGVVVIDAVESTPGLLDGADAAIIIASKPPTAKALKVAVKTVGDLPLGVWWDNYSNLKILDSNGVDFVVFTPEKMPLAVVSENKPGRVMKLPLDLSDSLIRSLNDLPVEAFIINVAGAALTFHDLLLLRRLGDWISKPLIAVVPVALGAEEIKALWDAGVDALAVNLAVGEQEAFKALRQTLASLDLETKRKWLKPRAIVPVVGVVEHGHDIESEPDEEDGGDE